MTKPERRRRSERVVQLRDMVSKEQQAAGWDELPDRLLVAGDCL